jgi:type II secretory pathway component PulF
MILHLGVNEVPEPESKINTFELANILEAKYTLFSKFGEMNEQMMADALAESLNNALEDILMGSPVVNPFADGEQAIEQRFRQFISKEELAGVVAGVPTQSALMGYSRRKKKSHAKNKRRPSFVDTGTLQNSIKVWMDGTDI